MKAEWFATWFGSEHYHRLYVHRSDDEAARFVDALIAQHPQRSAAAVLDLGCGRGAIRSISRRRDSTSLASICLPRV